MVDVHLSSKDNFQLSVELLNSSFEKLIAEVKCIRMANYIISILHVVNLPVH